MSVGEGSGYRVTGDAAGGNGTEKRAASQSSGDAGSEASGSSPQDTENDTSVPPGDDPSENSTCSSSSDEPDANDGTASGTESETDQERCARHNRRMICEPPLSTLTPTRIPKAAARNRLDPGQLFSKPSSP